MSLQKQQSRYTDPSDKPYFYGRLLREEANRILEKRGLQNGLFLLRESVFEVGSYALSLCHNKQVQHYKLERLEDGTVAIGRNSQRFIGPIELIKYHQTESGGGLVCRPSIPCNRSDDNITLQPIKYLFIHDVDLYKLIQHEIQKHMNQRLKTYKSITKPDYDMEMEECKGRFRYKFEKIVTKNIHLTQAWFIKELSRDDANRLLRESGLEDGKFLVRTTTSKTTKSASSSNTSSGNSSNNSISNHHQATTSDDSDATTATSDQEYKISLCFKGEVKHYQIRTKLYALENSYESKYYIDDSFEFDTIIQLVDYFHRCSVGFLCNLRVAYLPPNNLSTMDPALESYLNNKSIESKLTSEKNIYNSNRMYNVVLSAINDENHTSNGHTHHHHKPGDVAHINYIDDEPNHSGGDIANLNNVPEKKRPLFENEENYEYNSLDRYTKLDTIDNNNLAVFDKLGTGCFASVYRGIYKVRVVSGTNGSKTAEYQEIPVAIKKLNMENMEESRRELEKEAELMRSLNNPFIIKFIGMCFNYQTSSIMIVLELAKLGPLHKYLRTHPEMSVFKIVKICYQVSIAMAYLAEKKLIHRDLAARNVLLVSEDIAKVSDFGLSRKMNEYNCYETHAHGKWPLKWYPPDATLGKFDEKSDVWSFGVTCWEATSYGARPYQGIEIATLILSLQNGHRLGKPSKCPDEIYQIMLKCWHADKHQRPAFKEIKEELKQTIFDLYQTYINYH